MDSSKPVPKGGHAEKAHSTDEEAFDSKDETRQQSFSSSAHAADYERKRMNAMLANPLRGYSHAQLRKMGKAYALEHALVEPEDFRAFELGAVLASSKTAFETCEGLTEEEKAHLQKELTHRWSQPKLMYLVIILCSTCAAVQGMGKISILFTRLHKLTLPR